MAKSGVCTRGASGTDCPKKRDGTYILDNQGVQTEQVWLYYGIIVLAFYWIGFFLGKRCPRVPAGRGADAEPLLHVALE